MKPNSTNSSLFSLLDFSFTAPSFIIQEFNKHEEECLKKSGLSKEEFSERKKGVFYKIKFLEFRDFRKFLNRAEKCSPDSDDVPYFALALNLNLPIWTNDAELKKQDKVKILSTEEVINLFID